ncbi:hypothetical protein ASPFODRAFT_720696 [Aspergillus luchuensis CBS 106.47]|uniref:Uncharacterized protein n=1 Tax=Aspergillus luchuensis (strain CBS 106.47) TaxID=1137211 RepID=A0A1M3TCE7_ASPLC|nr:hypothetical protein ASPFODRAFT_720696 [Aspergillus luchuensis CBS 106.47]
MLSNNPILTCYTREPFNSGWASRSSQHGGSEAKRRSGYDPPYMRSRITPDMRRKLDDQWILLKEKLFGSSEGTAELSHDPKEEDKSDDEASHDNPSNNMPSAEPLSDPGLSEDSPYEGECSDDERSDDGLLDDPSFNDESSNNNIWGVQSVKLWEIRPFGMNELLEFLILFIECNDLLHDRQKK